VLKSIKELKLEEPQFEHDCESCIFLGRYDWNKFAKNKSYDLYIHLNKDGLNSFIAREGSNGPDYISSPYGWRSPTDYPTRIAYDRAVEQKLIKSESGVQTLNYGEKIAEQNRFK